MKSAFTFSHQLKTLLIIITIVLSVLLLSISVSFTQSGCTALEGTNGPSWPKDATVYVNLGNLNTEQRRQVQEALSAWNRVAGFGSGVTFSTATPPSGAIILNFQVGQTIPQNGVTPPAQLNTTGHIDGNGNLNGGTITFSNTVQAIGADQQNHLALDETVSSTAFTKAALHEIGHSMGLGDGTTPYGGTSTQSNPCGNAGQVQASSVMNALCGPNDDGNNMPTTVGACDYNAVKNETAYTPTPTPTPSPTPCAGQGQSCYYDGDCCTGHCGELTYSCRPCEPNPQDPYSSCMSEACESCYGQGGVFCTAGGGNCWTPVLLDIEGNGFNLTNADNGVNFDDGNGTILRTAWTSANSDDAWLVLDRNGNGTIDDGSELFGNAAPQPQPSSAKEIRNGFAALTQYDNQASGGNNDGMINRRDSIFPNLRLWQDLNHNGISEASELHSLESLNVDSIRLDYKVARRSDGNGNTFRYRVKVDDAKHSRVGRWAWDVFLSAHR